MHGLLCYFRGKREAVFDRFKTADALAGDCFENFRHIFCIDSRPVILVCGMSRSGTTLLCTILDSHSRISMGYELISPKIASVAKLRSILAGALGTSGGNLPKAGKIIQKTGQKETGKFIIRCHRAGIYTKDMTEVLETVTGKGIRSLKPIKNRLALASEIAQKAMHRKKADFCGFKYTSTAFDIACKLFPEAFFVFICRDPRDVAASHIERNFARTVTGICKAWNHHANRFMHFSSRYPEKCNMVKYEDLVSKPAETINRIFEILPLEVEDGLINFQDSDASIYKSSHPNTDKLRKGFFTSSIGRWEKDLTGQNTETIVRYCRKHMTRLGYL